MKLERWSAVRLAIAALWIGACGPLAAEEVEVAGLRATVIGPSLAPAPRQQPAWGTLQLSARVIHGLSFKESVSGITVGYSSATTHRYRTGGSESFFDAELSDLPAGALITGIDLEACDTNALQHVTLYLFKRESPNGPSSNVGAVTTGDLATAGCAIFGDPMNLVGVGETVENREESYFVRADLSATDSSTSLGAARVYYQLQVSPAPAVATFNDVPTGHRFFRFVEALAASGITAGCGGGNYCPDVALTRGQMAVFLSVALGLNFPY